MNSINDWLHFGVHAIHTNGATKFLEYFMNSNRIVSIIFTLIAAKLLKFNLFLYENIFEG